MDRRGPYRAYTSVAKYRGIKHSVKSREGVATTPPLEDVLQKIPQEDEG